MHPLCKKPEAVLAARLKDARDGKLVSLSFELYPPAEHLDEYDTVIEMLEMDQEILVELIALTAQEFRQFVMDEWDWTDSFLSSNVGYSVSAMAAAEARGISE